MFITGPRRARLAIAPAVRMRGRRPGKVSSARHPGTQDEALSTRLRCFRRLDTWLLPSVAIYIAVCSGLRSSMTNRQRSKGFCPCRGPSCTISTGAKRNHCGHPLTRCLSLDRQHWLTLPVEHGSTPSHAARTRVLRELLQGGNLYRPEVKRHHSTASSG